MAGLPYRYAAWTLAAYPAIASAVRGWLADPSSWSLYLWGPTRSRKTSAACAVLRELRVPILRQWIERAETWIREEKPGVPPRPAIGEFVGPYTFADTIRDVTSDAARARLDEWGEMPLLLLDDLGKYRDTPHLVEQTLLLLHKRYDRHDCRTTRTIITSNMGLDELAARIDPATGCRLAEGLVLELCSPPVERTDADGPTPVQRS